MPKPPGVASQPITHTAPLLPTPMSFAQPFWNSQLPENGSLVLRRKMLPPELTTHGLGGEPPTAMRTAPPPDVSRSHPVPFHFWMMAPPGTRSQPMDHAEIPPTPTSAAHPASVCGLS